MRTIREYIDEAIRTGRIKNDAELSRLCGVKPATVSRWRSGDRVPDDDEAVQLAMLLGKEPGELLAECGAARAKSQTTREAWERVAARMAAYGITVCLLIVPVVSLTEGFQEPVNKLLFSELAMIIVISALFTLKLVMTEHITHKKLYAA